MAYKFVQSHHMKAILNDVEEKQKKDIKDYTSGHLNESVLLRAPVALTRRSWTSAQKECIHLIKPVKTLKKPRVLKEQRSPKDALYDFALGTSGVIPGVQWSASKAPEIRYRILTEVGIGDEKKQEPCSKTPQSLYSQLEDGVLVEELPPYDLIIPDHHIRSETLMSDGGDDQTSLTEDSMIASQTSIFSKMSKFGPPHFHKHLALPVHNQGITKMEQYRNKKTLNLVVVPKKEDCEKLKILSGERTAIHHEQKLQQELENVNLDSVSPNLHHLQACNNVLDDIMEESPSLSYILHSIKTEYDNYIIKLLAGQTTQQHYLQGQVNQMVSHGTSRPQEMAEANERLKFLEMEAKYLLDINQRLHEDVKSEHEHLNQTPEVPVKKPITGGYLEKKQPVDLSVELENMKALILEKLDELNSLRLKTRANYVPVTVCTHLEQCIKETEVEVQKLLKQNEYFERSIAEMESELEQAITEADTSEKDARRIWRKVNSTRGMPGLRQVTGAESDDDDDESKWNWYIS